MIEHEKHHLGKSGWLRATVLGANDGVLSVSSIILGVASADRNFNSILIAGIAGLVAGAMSMAAGEYVSVHSQADIEEADLSLERRQLEEDADSERDILVAIYVERGLTRNLATQVVTQLMAADALEAFARDELGITNQLKARPVQAAFASACSFTAGASVPILAAMLSSHLQIAVSSTSILFLLILGALSAHVGGAPVIRGAVRVTIWGIFAMAVTAIVGTLFHTIV